MEKSKKKKIYKIIMTISKTKNAVNLSRRSFGLAAL